jgi:type VI secretion system secreted protein VgrG
VSSNDHTEFTFTWDGGDGPSHLRVVAFTGREAISELFRYELTLLAREPARLLDPDELVGQRATLRIATMTESPLRYVHGVVAEAEELRPVPGGMLYRAVLMPPLVRAAHRTRCRIFLEKTTRDIVRAVLCGDPRMAEDGSSSIDADGGLWDDYSPAKERFSWRIRDTSRIDDAKTRPYCVQYSESDFHFVARLLEEEGHRFHFEHGKTACLLVISDTDDGALRLGDAFGPHLLGCEVSAIQLGKRLRASKVNLIDYNWRKPLLDMRVEASASGDGGGLFETAYPGLYPDALEQGQPLALARLGRLQSEAKVALVSGTSRLLCAGAVFEVEHPEERYAGEYVATALDVRGESAGELPPGAMTLSGIPYSVRIECARRGKGSADSGYRPARATPKPRIVGSQTAFVTAEPSSKGAEIHVGGPEGAEVGCVRLKFHWDTETARHDKEPTSSWVRVSQLFAGAGEGALWHPRVGTEVVVEYLDGDPDRPIVVGRVYNGKNRPPAGANGAPTVSTFKSTSSPGAGVYNELLFDDAAGSELVKLHAGKNWVNEVGHDRSETVTNHSKSDVGVNRTESTGADRSTTVKGNNTESVGADESITIGANQKLTVGADQTVSVSANRSESIGGNDTLGVGGNKSATIGGNRSEAVAGNGEQSIGGKKSVSVGGLSVEQVGGDRAVSVGGTMVHAVTGNIVTGTAADMMLNASGNTAVVAGADVGVQAGGQMTLVASADAAMQGANIYINSGGEIVLSAGGGVIKIGGGGVEISGGSVKISGGTIDATAGSVNLN